MQKRKKIELNGERRRQKSTIIVARQKAMRNDGRKYISPPLCLWILYFCRLRECSSFMFQPLYFDLNYFVLSLYIYMLGLLAGL